MSLILFRISSFLRSSLFSITNALMINVPALLLFFILLGETITEASHISLPCPLNFGYALPCFIFLTELGITFVCNATAACQAPTQILFLARSIQQKAIHSQ